MNITFHTEQIEFPKIDSEKLIVWIKTVASKYNKKAGDISYIFCNDEKILEVNQQYLQHDFYTDIITFDYSEEKTISGDIFISIDTVISNSEKFETEFTEELHRVIIHGILHLCGINDITDEEEKEMRKAEDEALNMLTYL